MSVTYMWLLAGVVFLAAEALGITGVGLLFAGLGALFTGMLLSLSIISEEHTIAQFVIFFMATATWTALLWKPMKKFHLGKSQGGYHNMIGDTAYIGAGGLTKGAEGEATWSGTIMKAELVKDAHVERLEAGAAASIVEVTGAKLIVKPKA